MSEEGIRIPFPYFSVRFTNRELVENYVLALVYMADTVLSELGYEEVNEENIGEVIRLFRQPILRLEEFRNFLEGRSHAQGIAESQKTEKRREEGEKVGNNYSQTPTKEEGSLARQRHKQRGDNAQVGAFVSPPTISSLFEYPLVPEEKKLLTGVVYKFLVLSEQAVEESDADN